MKQEKKWYLGGSTIHTVSFLINHFHLPHPGLFGWRRLPRPPARWVSPNSILDPVILGNLKSQGGCIFLLNPNCENKPKCAQKGKKSFFFCKHPIFRGFYCWFLGGVHPNKLNCWALRHCHVWLVWLEGSEVYRARGIDQILFDVWSYQHILVALYTLRNFTNAFFSQNKCVVCGIICNSDILLITEKSFQQLGFTVYPMIPGGFCLLLSWVQEFLPSTGCSCMSCTFQVQTV